MRSPVCFAARKAINSRVARRRPISERKKKKREAPAARAVTARAVTDHVRRRDGLLALCLILGRFHPITRAAGEEQREAEDGARVGSHPSN